MMSKLTLSIDKDTIESAKRYAARHHTSVSRLVTGFLADLHTDGDDGFFSRLHDDLKREGYRALPDGDEERLRRRHMERKYR